MTPQPMKDLSHFVAEKNYGEAVAYYEQLVEQAPNTLSHYLELGIAYLLQGEEDKAQLSWFVALGSLEGDAFAEAVAQLCELLDVQANLLTEKEEFQQAWLLRGHLREQCPDDLLNIFKLIDLEVRLDIMHLDKLQEWGVIELIRHQGTHGIPEELLKKVTYLVLECPHELSVEFAEALFVQPEVPMEVMDLAYQAAMATGKNKIHVDYAIEVLKILVGVVPTNLSLVMSLGELYDKKDHVHEAIALFDAFDDRELGFFERFWIIQCRFWTRLRNYCWDERASALQAEQEKLLEEMLRMGSDAWLDLKTVIRNAFASVVFPFYYLYDDQARFRLYLNFIGQSLTQRTQKMLVEALEDQGKTVDWRFDDSDYQGGERLRIGLVGTTFHSHSVGYLARWLLVNHQDKDNIEYYVYYIDGRPDDVTQWYQNNVKHIYVFSSSTVAPYEKIKEDKIHILIDLDGITNSLTYQLMCVRPAPVQVSWLGFDAPGLPTIDYYLADDYVIDPAVEPYYQEKIWKLPRTYLAVDGFEMGAPTVKRQDLEINPDAVVFLNFQNSFKLNPDIMRLQLRIIKAVPNSVLLIKNRKGSQDALLTYLTTLAQEEGVDPGCIVFMKSCPTVFVHRANLAVADVILDTYPYNGATTTLESLWAEIPVVTRVGQQFSSRNSYGFMMNAGITEGIAWTDEEYIEWGIKLGRDENLRKEISWKLRQSKQTAPLWDGKRFAKEMENAYRQMWEIYVKQNSGQE